jgi:hypothetical protein
LKNEYQWEIFDRLINKNVIREQQAQGKKGKQQEPRHIALNKEKKGLNFLIPLIFEISSKVFHMKQSYMVSTE